VVVVVVVVVEVVVLPVASRLRWQWSHQSRHHRFKPARNDLRQCSNVV